MNVKYILCTNCKINIGQLSCEGCFEDYTFDEILLS